jgi:hypothetical protein
VTIDETVLPTFSVLARFREPAPTGDVAVGKVAERLRRHAEPVQQVLVEREDEPGVWMVTGRFVLVSVDSATAVAGLSETLADAGLVPDEVWADAQVA